MLISNRHAFPFRTLAVSNYTFSPDTSDIQISLTNYPKQRYAMFAPLQPEPHQDYECIIDELITTHIPDLRRRTYTPAIWSITNSSWLVPSVCSFQKANIEVADECSLYEIRNFLATPPIRRHTRTN